MAGFMNENLRLRHFNYCVGLRAFLALDDLELHLIAFLKALISFRLHSAVVDENIRSTFLADKSEALGVVKPLDCSFNTRHFHTFHNVLFWETVTAGDPSFQKPPLGTAQAGLLDAREVDGEQRTR